MMIYNGMRVIEDATLVDAYEDWSLVRSPGRARRRRKKGCRQNIIIRAKPKEVGYIIGNTTIVMHPEMADLLRRHIREANDDAHRRDN